MIWILQFDPHIKAQTILYSRFVVQKQEQHQLHEKKSVDTCYFYKLITQGK